MSDCSLFLSFVHRALPRRPSVVALLSLQAVLACAPPPVPDDEPCELRPGVACVVAGHGEAGVASDGDDALTGSLYLPMDVTVTSDGALVVADFNTHRMLAVREGTIRVIAGSGFVGDPVEGPATEVELKHPTSATELPSGELLVTAWHNYRVIRLDPGWERLEMVAGTGDEGFSGDGAAARDAAVVLPMRVIRAPLGGVYILDQGNLRVRHIDEDGVIRTVAGSGDKGFAGDGGPALDAAFNFPQGDAATPAGGIAAASDGRLFIADTYNHRVRVVEPDGVIRTIAGTGEAGTGGDGGRALETALDRPTDLAVGPAGALFIADTGNSCVRRLDQDDRLLTVAGRCGERGDGDDGAPAIDTLLDRPYGIVFGEGGDLYIADTHNHRVRVVGGPR